MTTVSHSEMMNALVFHQYGPASNLKYEQVPKPIITSPTDIIVRVKATGVNPADCKIRNGELLSILRFPMPVSLGIDFAGVVDQIGTNVKNFKVGDEIYGKISIPSNRGTYAQYVKVDSRKDALVMKPENVTFEEVGGIGVIAQTAYYSLVEHGKIKQNDRVLVIAASGGVGCMAVQIAKIFGAHVTGICSSKNVDFVKSLGADSVIDYTNGIKESLKQHEKFNIVVDAFGGDEYYKTIKPFIAKGGVYSTAVGPTNVDAFRGWNLFKSLCKLACRSFTFRYKWILSLPGVMPPALNEWLKDGKLRVIVSQIINLEDGAKAHELSETNRTVGKIILKVQ